MKPSIAHPPGIGQSIIESAATPSSARHSSAIQLFNNDPVLRR
jgi:hypothetical protein